MQSIMQSIVLLIMQCIYQVINHVSNQTLKMFNTEEKSKIPKI